MAGALQVLVLAVLPAEWPLRVLDCEDIARESLDGEGWYRVEHSVGPLGVGCRVEQEGAVVAYADFPTLPAAPGVLILLAPLLITALAARRLRAARPASTHPDPARTEAVTRPPGCAVPQAGKVAPQVAGPTMPSTARPFFDWKSRHAAYELGP
ncbi:hypothetical protein [Streptomyces sp. CMB-StM0423]|uniref:hypothetical protein n=1 Tax=Streptomyces sp. CMB-StM0423 TaxID=2059884 RepID=UPI00131B1EC7|nr:hypothetical protein [Streptomyces sp. CMB-StM0423]